MNRKILRNGVFIAIVALAVSATLLFNFLLADMEKRESETAVLLQNQASVIQKNFSTIVEQAYALRAFIIGSNGDYKNLDSVADYILKYSDIRNVLLAPNSVVNKVLPPEGNEAVLGLDLTSEQNKSYKDAIEAIESRKPIFSGPYTLIQGGEAISLRFAIFFNDSLGVEKYWGLTSITVNFPEVIGNLATNFIVDSGYDYILSKKDGQSGLYKEISSHVETPDAHFIPYDFSVYNLDFRFEATPQKGFLDWKKALILGTMAIFLSITLGAIASALSLFINNLAEKAGRDVLTGLLNREGGVRHINNRIRESEFSKGAFILLDVDNFKSVNDTLGHPKGDEVLIETATILKGLCRSMDILCRLGGDEFLIFFSYDKDSDFALKKAESIRQALERTVTDGSKSVDISSSIGISFFLEGQKNFEKLYKEADIALYESKERGKNTVTVYEQGAQA
ncbi:MAG: sensor domain-containing diguanylate cyclase [Fretibacterium sp.]|nr:sensor domain-containing diguanylate cyclase [Fretibacterium sp.]